MLMRVVTVPQILLCLTLLLARPKVNVRSFSARSATSGVLTLRCLPLLQGGSNGGLLMGAVLNQVSHLLPAERLSCHARSVCH